MNYADARGEIEALRHEIDRQEAADKRWFRIKSFGAGFLAGGGFWLAVIWLLAA